MILKSQNNMSKQASNFLGIKNLNWKIIIEEVKKIKIEKSFIGKMHQNYDIDNQRFHVKIW